MFRLKRGRIPELEELLTGEKMTNDEKNLVLDLMELVARKEKYRELVEDLNCKIEEITERLKLGDVNQ